ncbi:hypothetical protein A9Q88_04600 [Gammaproteobacteria bacterium 50_400_T64]|nr:hypothetical protein A9Q88_04600 [Gammaproteobacteria bacterium 50_400_T64]
MSFHFYLLVLCLSIALQFSTCIISLIAMRYTHASRWVWGVLAFAMLLMGVRQLIILLAVWSEPSLSSDIWMTALLELSIAFCLCFGLGARLPALMALNRRLEFADSDRIALAESELKYRELIESTGAGYVILDAAANVLECNETYIKLVGRNNPEEVIGHNVIEWLDESRSGTFLANEMQGHSQCELRAYNRLTYFRPDGSFIPVEVYSRGSQAEDGLRVVAMVRDVSEREATRIALEESEEKYRSLIESTGTGYVILDTKGDVLDCNETYLKMLGRDAIIGHNLSEWVKPSESERYVRSEVANYLESEVRVYESEIFRHPDNVAVPVDVYSRAKEMGDDIQLIALVRDVSERVQARKKLEASERRANLLFENSPISTAVFASDGQFLRANKAHDKLWGVVISEEFPELNILEDEQVNRMIGKETLAAIFRGEHKELESFVYKCSDLGFDNARDNTILPMFFPLLDDDGEVESIVQMHVDLTERISAEQKLSEREALYRALVESTDAGYVVMTSEKIVIEANAEYARLAGRSDVSEIIGQHTRDWIGGDTGLAEFSHVLENGGGLQGVRLDFIHPDGTLIPTEASVASVDLGDERKVVALARDISERIESEGRLRQAQKMDAIGKLTGGVAHDFNNLLGVILGNAELALANKFEPGSIDRYLQAVLNAAERGADLTHRLLAFSRQTPLAPKVINIQDALENVCVLLQRLIGEDVDLVLVKTTGLANCEVDPSELENVIINLANNARDAMPGGGKLIIKAREMMCESHNAMVQTGELTAGEYVVVSVTDSGTGIAPELLHRVTDPFFTTKDVGKGTGLGLSMAYGFAKQSKGHLSIYSELGEGATVNIYLPAHHDSAHAIKSDKAAVIPRGNEKILLVEDDPALMELACNMLEVLGYRVEAADNVEKGIALYQQHVDFDLLLTDMILPGGRNGKELADELLAINSGLKVMYMSGYTENAVLHHGRLDEGVMLLQKPFRTAELSAMVRQVLDS